MKPEIFVKLFFCVDIYIYVFYTKKASLFSPIYVFFLLKLIYVSWIKKQNIQKNDVHKSG